MGKIRRMKETDLRQVLEIERKTFTSPWSPEAFSSEMSNPFSKLYVWEEEKTVKGYIVWRSILGEVHILNLAVHPDARRKGIGSSLVSFCIESEKNASYFVLEVRLSNIAAIKLYRKLGFKEVGVVKNYYSFPREDGLIMMRRGR